MKSIYFLLFFIGLSASGWAQNDFVTKSKPIPRLKIPAISPDKSSNTTAFPSMNFSSSIFDGPVNPLESIKPNNSSFQIGEDNSKFGAEKEKFANPGDVYVEKLKQELKGEGNGDSRIFKRDQSFGEIRTKSEYVKIIYRDHEYVDGDMIKFLVNGKIMIPQIILYGEYKGTTLGLEKGFNKLDFEALNQGSSGPNTAEFQVYDDKGTLLSANRWDLATGFKATIMIIKE
ncbi:hypothetical protein [Flavobacterium cerinum]|uniref:Secreted protein n=1 Tax=Flavobacterium cerinum TaxID=2502784 RepID=A0ABY5IQE1_9FLAO|nr:hypothetical protein [Flavobacterium cerinum]UUC45038.1 hypothetical protein NOX80_15585 [Flavobacterium cerinum]